MRVQDRCGSRQINPRLEDNLLARNQSQWKVTLSVMENVEDTDVDMETMVEKTHVGKDSLKSHNVEEIEFQLTSAGIVSSRQGIICCNPAITVQPQLLMLGCRRVAKLSLCNAVIQ